MARLGSRSVPGLRHVRVRPPPVRRGAGVPAAPDLGAPPHTQHPPFRRHVPRMPPGWTSYTQ